MWNSLVTYPLKCEMQKTHPTITPNRISEPVLLLKTNLSLRKLPFFILLVGRIIRQQKGAHRLRKYCKMAVVLHRMMDFIESWLLPFMVCCFLWSSFVVMLRTEQTPVTGRTLRSDVDPTPTQSPQHRMMIPSLAMDSEMQIHAIPIGRKGRQINSEEIKQKIRDNDPLFSDLNYITSRDEVLSLVPELQSKRVVYVITPTYHRLFQMPDIVRMSHALMLDGGVYWIVTEDTKDTNLNVDLRRFLYETGVPFAHVVARQEVNPRKHRGVSQRNRGLDVIHQIGLPGVVYFADDDNVYDHRLFDELRQIHSVGVFASGFTGHANYETCVWNANATLISRFATNWAGRSPKDPRTFAVDMGGFAINANLLFQKPDWRISSNSKIGYMENDMISSFIHSPEEAESIGNCTQVYFWHMPKYDMAASS
jgi:hypothetical protein